MSRINQKKTNKVDNLTELPYPTEEAICCVWDEGIIGAQDICKSLGMYPTKLNLDNLNEDERWKKNGSFT